ncbi:3-phenylpropionate/cinnamic acid dioxygenase subunit beta [Sphingobium sp. TCM1]|uniref:3-phenylpropionate/cinnamic acid dioxygenase subunit beta n=1 Tax=Sphingobium sp. TCM1 TaxID=453246 RepID=UPI0007F3A47F|nr:3-phenylpropionate/cinnamic acid dioxygenase subunit beta [Sphingobium sp. TCM1]OAN56228.1 aromatic-ring-hydroxylating dioxygenase subunit beta [Sphingobium sp. TCM1]
MATAEMTAIGEMTGARVMVGSPIYNEVTQFLYEEALALDHRDFDTWTAMLAKDLRYTAPLRITRTGPARNDDIVRNARHFDDDYRSIMGRLGRLGTKSAWAEDPPSRTRRLVTNILVRDTDREDEFAVSSYLYMKRSRYDDPTYKEISAERRDMLRRIGPAHWQIARREIIIDQSVLGMSNLAVFL